MYVLYSALTGDKTNNLGAIIEHQINTARTMGDIYCGYYARLLTDYMHASIRHTIDAPIDETDLLG